MNSSYGENIHLSLFGQSHSKAIGMTLEGIPAGKTIDFEELYSFLDRRAPGKNIYSSQRKEADIPNFLCGFVGNTTCGAPITAIIENKNAISKDYEAFRYLPRPGHADYTAEVKYKGFEDFSGGGHFSARLTAPLCIAGGLCKQLLKKEGISIISRIFSIGNILDEGELEEDISFKNFPTVNENQGEKMKALIEQVKEQKDSVGGIVECKILGLPVGLGGPLFGGMESRISSIAFGIPAVKGIEFGSGFLGSSSFGSQNNDAFIVKNQKITTKTNNSGGILGGITNGMPLDFKLAFKPTSSIGKRQETVNLKTLEAETLSISGRHDPCVVLRALPCVEAAAALAVYDVFLERKKD